MFTALLYLPRGTASFLLTMKFMCSASRNSGAAYPADGSVRVIFRLPRLRGPHEKPAARASRSRSTSSGEDSGAWSASWTGSAIGSATGAPRMLTGLRARRARRAVDAKTIVLLCFFFASVVAVRPGYDSQSARTDRILFAIYLTLHSTLMQLLLGWTHEDRDPRSPCAHIPCPLQYS